MKKLLGVYYRVENQHGYDQSILTVLEGERESLPSLMEGCVDNKAGYGTLEAAVCVHTRCQDYSNAGYVERFDVSTYGHIRFDLRYQHYEKDFCNPHLTLRDDPECALPTAAFISKLTKKGFPASPEEFMMLLYKQRTYDIIKIDKVGNEYLVCR